MPLPSQGFLLSDLRLKVRRALGDFPKVQVDTVQSYDGSSNPMPTGKDLPIETNSETVKVSGVAKVRGTDYTIDYDARQLTWINLPASATSLWISYKECVYRTEQIDDGINAGRKLLFPTFYKIGYATVTVRNLVRDYDLSSSDVNEPGMRAVFAEGRRYYKIVRMAVMPLGSSDQWYRPFRRWWPQGETGIHLWDLPGVGDTLRIEAMYAFQPLYLPTDPTDIPDTLIDMVTDYATSTLALKQEPLRGRIDTAAIAQSTFANPPGTMAQTSDDFVARMQLARKYVSQEPVTFELPEAHPRPWELVRAR